uniref:Polysaccharide biosynthesis enzyme WcbI domain-containing protein n=1 Tax=viral metagenome TaxID=1070528 RepID=A0A6C0F6R1_9ZZZZ|tara:strand:+ start:470 stop:1039 length:570 start_codon:yes stop_codon:yes gene_type:complete
MKIVFIGNCQTLSLCYYFQELLKTKITYNIYWLMYGEEFRGHLTGWSIKCKNKILDYNESIRKIKESSIIIYQNISLKKTAFCNTKTLYELKRENCKIIQMSSIFIDMSDFDNSIKNMIERENKNNTTLSVSKILIKFRDKNLLRGKTHPTTFLFMEIMKSLCKMLNIDFFKDEYYYNLLKNTNHMGLA